MDGSAIQISIPVSHIDFEHPHGGADRAAAGVSAATMGPPRHVPRALVGVLVHDDIGPGAEDLFIEGVKLGDPELPFRVVVGFRSSNFHAIILN